MKHKRILPHWVTDSDKIQNDATCVRFGMPEQCGHMACPRHSPAAYADSMARHATDSIAS